MAEDEQDGAQDLGRGMEARVYHGTRTDLRVGRAAWRATLALTGSRRWRTGCSPASALSRTSPAAVRDPMVPTSPRERGGQPVVVAPNATKCPPHRRPVAYHNLSPAEALTTRAHHRRVIGRCATRGSYPCGATIGPATATSGRYCIRRCARNE